jgi:murein DD-endopeptidase MepM/ murein hydrolase activator NlpD
VSAGSRGLAWVAALLTGPVPFASGAEVTTQVGRLAIRVETDRSVPGGFLVVAFESPRRLGRLTAIFEGRRASAFDSAEGLRALVPIPLTTPPGEWTLGVELAARRGLQHVRVDVPVAPRDYAERSQTAPEPLLAAVRASGAGAEGRRLMLLVRSESPEASFAGGFVAPVSAPVTPDGFGSDERWIPDIPLERLRDGAWGRQRRSLEYAIPAGTHVVAPAGGRVVFAGELALTGGTVVVDHGQGIVTALQQLGRIDVGEGDQLVAAQAVGLSGLGPRRVPLLAWSVHMHGIAVDPRLVLERLR